jgi:hypothetical protein
VCLVGVDPHIAAALHAQRVQEARSHPGVERLPAQVPDDALQIDVSLARVGEPLACGKVDAQWLFLGPPVGKAGCVAEHAPRRDLVQARIVRDVRLGEIGA